MKQTFTDRLKSMKVGDVITEDIANCSSVRAMCSTCGLRWNRIYTTSTQRSERKITVIRTK